MTDTVITERHGHVLLIGLNRPDKLNAFDVDMIRDLAEAYTELAEDPELRCGVLWAQGRYFTSGLDLNSLVKNLPAEVASRITKHIPFVELVTPAIPRGRIDPWGVSTPPCPKPVVTAVHGRCYTLGIELMLSAQVNIAGDEATFTQYEVGRGLFPFGGGTVRWPLAVGTHNAYRYLLTGEEFDAAEALRMGLVQQVVPTDKCLPAAMEMAQKIAAQAPLGVQAVLRNTRLAQAKGAETALGKVQRELVRLMLSKDVRRGLAAYRARTTAAFRGD